MYERADDRPRLRGLRLPRRPLRPGARRRRGRRDATRRSASASASSSTELLAVRFTGYRTLTALAQGPDPRPRGRPGEGHDGQRGDRRRRADRRRRSAPTRCDEDSEWAYMISFLPGLKSAGGTEADPAQHDRRARPRAAARAAPGQGHPVQRAARQGEGGGGVHELRTVRRAGVPARGRARRALARQDRRGRPRGARGARRRCPTCGRRRSRPAGPGC